MNPRARRPRHGGWLLPLLALALILGLATTGRQHGPALAGLVGTLPAAGTGDRFVAAGDLTLRPGEVVEHDAITGAGDIVVPAGAHVKNDVVAGSGDIEIGGTVDHDVRAVNGDVTLLATAHVGHDVTVANGTVHQARGAQVAGHIIAPDVEGPPSRDSGLFGLLLRIFSALILGATLVGLGVLVVLIWPRALNRVVSVLDDAPWPALLVGLITGVFILPVAALATVVLAITIVGILLIPVLWLALVLGWAFGLVAVALWAGRRLADSGHVPAAQGSLLRTAVAGLLLVAGVILLPSLLLAGWIGWPVAYFLGFIGLGAAVLQRLSAQGGSLHLGPLRSPAVTRPLSPPSATPPSDRRAS